MALGARVLGLSAQEDIPKPHIAGSLHGSFRELGIPYFGVLRIRSLLFSVLYQGPLFSETPNGFFLLGGSLERDLQGVSF